MTHQGDFSAHEQLNFPTGLRVLVVDDDPTCLKLMDRLLRDCKYIVTTTKSANEAIELIKEDIKKFDIVITDVEMPDMDGFKLLKHAHDMNIPVIMVSAYADTKRVMESIRNGASDYLVKPVEIQVLRNIWQHVVRRNEFVMIKRHHIGIVDHEATSSESSKGESTKEKSPELVNKMPVEELKISDA